MYYHVKCGDEQSRDLAFNVFLKLGYKFGSGARDLEQWKSYNRGFMLRDIEVYPDSKFMFGQYTDIRSTNSEYLVTLNELLFKLYPKRFAYNILNQVK